MTAAVAPTAGRSWGRRRGDDCLVVALLVGFGVFFLAYWITSIRTEIVRRRVLSLSARRAMEADHA